jgi:hypothetical protein
MTKRTEYTYVEENTQCMSGHCKAQPGDPCITKAGNPTVPHQVRVDAYKELLAYGEKIDADAKAHEGLKTNLASEEEYNRRIGNVLWAINFARTMGVLQDQIDFNMAKMIVETELDMRLF